MEDVSALKRVNILKRKEYRTLVDMDFLIETQTIKLENSLAVHLFFLRTETVFRI